MTLDLSPLMLAFPGFLAVSARVGGLFAVMPILSSPAIPRRIKVALVFGTATLIVSAQGIPPLWEFGLGSFIAVSVRESFLGLAVGFLVRLALEAYRLAGHYIGFQMGFSLASAVDPQFPDEASVISSFHSLAAVQLMIVANVHLAVLLAISRSFTLVPVVSSVAEGSLAGMLITVVNGMFRTALAIAAPGFVLLLLMDAVLGVVGRFVPQMQVLLVGFPLKIAVGLLSVGIGLSAFTWFTSRISQEIWEDLGQLITAFQ